MSRVDSETLAEGLAAEGRDELTERFRDAYAAALGTHADLVSFDSERVESMVQRSAAEADGLQWRRALAGVAARELDIDLGSALTHPAVVRAHQLAGAPSYESALAALAVGPPPAAPPPAPPVDVDVQDGPEGSGNVELGLIAHEEAEPDAVEAEELDTTALDTTGLRTTGLRTTGLDAAAPDEGVPDEAFAELSPGSALQPELPVTDPEPEPPVEEPEPPAVELPGSEPTEPEVPAAERFNADPPTMAYETLEAEADPDLYPEVADPDPGEDGDETQPPAEPSDDVVGHRADDFAEEFMAGEPAVALELPAVEDDNTFEQDAVEVPRLDEDVTEFSAVHLGGVASLPSSEEITLRLSEEGLDLLEDDGTIVGRLSWTDIAALEVTVPHGRRRRRSAPRLVVHTAGGSARFDAPTLSGEELQDRVQPLMARFGH